MSLTIGSAATGYGGLDGAVAAMFGARVIWVADNDPDVGKILAERSGGVPNLGDVTRVDWSRVVPPDIFCAGFPCQDVSGAGLGAGIQPGNRSGLWLHLVKAISILRPKIVVIENVLGLLTAPAHSDLEPCVWCVGERAGDALRAYGAVLGALSGLGFDAEGEVVPASAAGACHQRKRVFILAWDRSWAAADPGSDRRAGGAQLDVRPAAGLAASFR